MKITTEEGTTEEEEKQYAEHLAALGVLATWPDAPGHLPSLATRKRDNEGALVPASELRESDRVRVRYLDYEVHKLVIGYAEILQLAHDPGCPWNPAFPARVWAIAQIPDGLPRWLRLHSRDITETAR